ncbi:hypothetical protein L3Q82_014207 [Scortum barcoo]|uniref:Uncharacterized protein n=1 Tax=Scortum barcoo TaxID=214431 RepID=A0ACB8VWI0_9TELE|nr:hypothetical protein L3Q82_014207 [Scortum barcoo]
MDMQVDAPLMAWIHNYLTGRPQYVRLGEHHVGHHCEQHGGPTEDGPVSLPVYALHLRLRSSRMTLLSYQQRPGGGVQECGGQVCGVVWTEPPAAQCHKDKGVGCGFQKTEDQFELSYHQGYRSGHCGQLQEAQIFQRLQDHAADVLSLGGIQRIIFYAVVCWGSRLKTADTNRLNKLIRRAGSVLGVELEPVEEVSERRMLRKLLSIMDNVCHPLHATLTSCQSSLSCRLRPPRSSTERHRSSCGGQIDIFITDRFQPPISGPEEVSALLSTIAAGLGPTSEPPFSAPLTTILRQLITIDLRRWSEGVAVDPGPTFAGRVQEFGCQVHHLFEVINPAAVRLKLPWSMRVHPTFHVSKVKLVHESSLIHPALLPHPLHHQRGPCLYHLLPPAIMGEVFKLRGTVPKRGLEFLHSTFWTPHLPTANRTNLPSPLHHLEAWL